MSKFFRRGALIALCLLAGCAGTPPSTPTPTPLHPRPPRPVLAESPWAEQSRLPSHAAATAGRWRHHPFPGKSPTVFSPARKGDRDAVMARSTSAASALRHQLHVPPEALGSVRFSWCVPALIELADMRLRNRDDSPVRVLLVFEGDRSRFSARDAMLSELALAITGEPLPYATLMYVWSNKRPAGEVIRNPRTGRIQMIVLQSGPAHLNRWLDYQRDIRADFELAFGESPGALIGVGLMTDTDNTRSTARAWYGPLQLIPRITAPVR